MTPFRSVPSRSSKTLQSRNGPVFAGKAGWRGATKEHTRQGSVTEEQRSQPAFPAKTLRATGLLREAFVGSTVTARCGDAPVSPPRPRTKSLVAGPFLFFRRALRHDDGVSRHPGEMPGPGGTKDNSRGQARHERGPRNRTEQRRSRPGGSRALRLRTPTVVWERLAIIPHRTGCRPRPAGARRIGWRTLPGAALVPRLPPAILPCPSGTGCFP